MIELNNLQAVGTVSVFIVSLLGFAVPFYLRNTHNNTSSAYSMLKTFASGIMLGVALMHLLVDALESLDDVVDYPLAPMCTGVGVILTLGVDQVALYLMSFRKVEECETGISTRDSPEVEHRYCQPRSRGIELAVVRSPTHKDEEDFPNENDILCRSESSDTIESNISVVTPRQKYVLKAYILEVAVAIHSIIIGFGFGAIDSSRFATIRVLIAAFVFHQFFEGISLGTVVLDSSLSPALSAKFALLFALTFPAGVVTAMIVQNSSDPQSVFSITVRGVANAIAAGILFHSTLSEMIPDDFSERLGRRSGIQVAGMYTALVTGFGLMALLAIWA